MAFSYSGNPSNSDLDYLRFATGDTVETAALFQDEELNYIISNNRSKVKRLAVAFRHAATLLSKKPLKRKLGPQDEDNTDRLKYFQKEADKYEKLSQYGGTLPLPEYEAEPVFGKGMMTNDA